MSKSAKFSHALQGEDSTVFCKFEQVLQYHPLIRSDFHLPDFLRRLWVVHDTGRSPNVTTPVHSLYHFIFDDINDRHALLPSLMKGETIAIMNHDKSRALSAITFAASGDSCVILYVATDVDIQSTGMATLLFSLVSVIMRCRTKKNEIWMYLKVNPKQNRPTAMYYKKLGFKAMQKKKVPDKLLEAFEDEAEDSPLHNYFDSKETELKWLYKKYIAKESKYERKEDMKDVKARFFTDPNWKGSPTTYAHLPGRLGLERLNHCAPDFEKTSASKLKHHVFSFSSGNTARYPPGCDVVHIPWVTRCFTKKNEGCTSDFLQIAISWLKRYPHADIWTKYMTIIPIAVMDSVKIMVCLFQQYREMMSMKNDESDESLNHIFQPHIDHKKFMEVSSCVIAFILENKNMFEKPYIAMLTCDDIDYFWGGFISFNAGKIAIGNQKDDSKENADNDCGYIQFEPLPVPEDDNDRTDSLRQLQYSFFLKLAYHVCRSSPRHVKKVYLKEDWMDESVAPWFQTMKHFETMFRNQKVNFGYVFAQDFERNDIVKGRFRTFDLPRGHPALSMPHTTKSDTAMASFTFLLEFCTSMKLHHDDHNPEKRLQDMTFANIHVRTEEGWNSYFFGMLVNLYQLVDRIASYQLGKDRVTYEEYKVCKLGEGRLLGNPQLGLREMLGEKIIPDLSFLNNWEATAPKLKVKDKKRWRTGEREVANRARKHTSDDTSEENSVTSRSSKKKKLSTESTKQMRIETVTQNVTAGIVTFPLDENVNSAETDSENFWDEQPSQTSLARGPEFTSEASVANKERRTGLKSANAESNPVMGMPNSSIPLDGVSSIVRIFKERYGEVQSDLEKENLFWEVFKLTQLQNPSTVVSEVISHIRKCFEEPEPNEDDVGCATVNAGVQFVEVRVSNKSTHSRFPNSYLKRTAELKVQYDDDIKSGSAVQTAMEKMYWILKREGFKFVHQLSADGGPWSEMCIGPAMQVLRRRVNNLRRGEKEEKKPRKKRKTVTESKEPIKDPSELVVAHDPPAPTWILGIGNPHYKGSLGNKEFRRRMNEYSPHYESLPPLSEERTNALTKFMEGLDGDGYRFMDLKDGVWIALDGQNKKMRKIRQAFAAHARRNTATASAKMTVPNTEAKSTSKKNLSKKKNLPESEKLPQGIDQGNEILTEKLHDKGDTNSPTEEKGGVEGTTVQQEIALVSSVLTNLANNTQETYVFHENDHVTFHQGVGVVDLTQPQHENESHDAHHFENDL